jgi:hypothetical protein
VAVGPVHHRGDGKAAGEGSGLWGHWESESTRRMVGSLSGMDHGCRGGVVCARSVCG